MVKEVSSSFLFDIYENTAKEVKENGSKDQIKKNGTEKGSFL